MLRVDLFLRMQTSFLKKISKSCLFWTPQNIWMSKFGFIQQILIQQVLIWSFLSPKELYIFYGILLQAEI